MTRMYSRREIAELLSEAWQDGATHVMRKVAAKEFAQVAPFTAYEEEARRVASEIDALLDRCPDDAVAVARMATDSLRTVAEVFRRRAENAREAGLRATPGRDLRQA